MRLLLVDDDPDSRELIRNTLSATALEYELLEAEDGPSGLARATELDIDCVLLDYVLPGCDAEQILRALLTRSDPPPAVLVISGAGDDMLAVELVAAGAFDYVSKDELTPSVLGRAIRHALARRDFAESDLERRGELRELRKAVAVQDLLESWNLSLEHEESPGGRRQGPDLEPALAPYEPYYRSLLERYLGALSSRVAPPRGGIKDLAGKLSLDGVRARDVIGLHLDVVTDLCQSATPAAAATYTVEGRLVALEVMGHVLDAYRARYLDLKRSPA